MSQQPPIKEGRPPTADQKQLVALFDEMEKKQVEFLDQAGKRIIELCTGVLGLLFAVTAFGKDFPPPYLAGNGLAKGAAVAALGLYIGAMLVALNGVQPRTYDRYDYNLTEMRKELDKIIQHKSGWVKAAGVLFWLGSLALAVLVGAVILSA
jgi:hypothetical protein